MAIPGTVFTKIPPRVRPGDPIRAEDFNTLTTAVRTLIGRGVDGGGVPGGGGSLCPLSKMSAADGADQFTINAGGFNAAGQHVEVGGPDGYVFTAVAATTAYCECVIDAEVLENTFTGNWTVNPATMLLGSGAGVADHVFTPDAPSGKVFAPLGVWDAEKKWTPNGCGDVTMLFCAQSTQAGYARFYRG